MRSGADPLIDIRRIVPAHREPIHRLLVATDVFSHEEIAIALELIDSVLGDESQTDYEIYAGIDGEGEVAGFYCIGPTPLTSGTYDLYWIAVKPSLHNKGVGKLLLKHAEEIIASRKGRLVLAETSSRPAYERTRRFYAKNEYREVARIQAYYTAGDDLVIYGKYLSQSGGR